MFIGHYAVALAAKKAAPNASLGNLFLASEYLDVPWPAFALTTVMYSVDSANQLIFGAIVRRDPRPTHQSRIQIPWSVIAERVGFSPVSAGFNRTRPGWP